MVYKIAIAALFAASSAKRLPMYDSQNILLSSFDWVDDEPVKDFDDGTVDEVHDYVPETELIQVQDTPSDEDYKHMIFEAGTADEVSTNPVLDELEEFDESLIQSGSVRREHRFNK